MWFVFSAFRRLDGSVLIDTCQFSSESAARQYYESILNVDDRVAQVNIPPVCLKEADDDN